MLKQDINSALIERIQQTLALAQAHDDKQKQAFELEFLHLPLQEWAGQIYDYFAHEVIDEADAYLIESTRSGLIKHVADNLELAKYANYIHKSGVVKAHGFEISNTEDVECLKESVDNLLAYRLRKPFAEVESAKEFSSVSNFTETWHSLVDKLPKPEDVVFTASKYHHIDDDCLKRMIKSMSTFLSKTRQLLVVSQDTRVNAFLRKAKEMGIPMTNPIYRDLYHCLEYFGLIDDEQLRLHNINPSRDAKEQFIKQKVKRID